MTHDWQPFRSHREFDRDAPEWCIKDLGYFWAHVVPFALGVVAAWVWTRSKVGMRCRWLGIYPDCATARRACERVLDGGRR